VVASSVREPPTPPWAGFPNKIGFLEIHTIVFFILFLNSKKMQTFKILNPCKTFFQKFQDYKESVEFF
jgi:hypothetical protein